MSSFDQKYRNQIEIENNSHTSPVNSTTLLFDNKDEEAVPGPRKYISYWHINASKNSNINNINAITPSSNSNRREPSFSDYEIDLSEIHFKNIGEVAAAALLNKRLQRGSITSADLPLRFRRNAAVLSDGKMVALYHQQHKLENKRSENCSVRKSFADTAPTQNKEE